MIEDEELRGIFKVASEEHVQHLESGLLHLESHPNDRTKLEYLLREAHSLKGDANMLGVRDVGTLAHQMEDLLGAVKRGTLVLSSEVSDRLYHGLDAIRKLINEAVTGEASGVNTFQVLAHLMGAPQQIPATEPAEETGDDATPELLDSVTPNLEAITPPTPPTLQVHATPTPALSTTNALIDTPATSAQLIEPSTSSFSPATPNGDAGNVAAATNGHTTLEPSYPSSLISEPLGDPRSAIAEPNTANNYRIETIRVETQKLDALMTQTGELAVTKIRIAHRLGEVEALTNLWEEWSRDLSVNRFTFNSVEHNDSRTKQVQAFYHRTEERLDRLGLLVHRLRSAAYEDTARLDVVTNELEEGIRTLRLLPLSTIFQIFPRMVRDLAKEQGKEINLVIEGGDTRADKRILEDMKDPLMHMLRNAIDHGIESPDERERLGKPRAATLWLTGYQTATSIVIEVRDDGRGLNLESIKQTALKREVVREADLAAMTPTQIQSLIFAPGFSTRTFVTEVSGRGVGLDVVRTNVERLKGTIQIESQPNQGCTFRVQMGTTLATAHVLIVDVHEQPYAIPVEFVQTTLLIQPNDIFSIEGCETIVLEHQPISIVPLSELLELNTLTASRSTSAVNSQLLPCIVLKVGSDRLGLLVDALLDEQDVVLKPQSKLLKRVRNVSGATILGTGEVCMVLNPHDLIKSVRKRSSSFTPRTFAKEQEKQQTILLVEDSITIRTQEKRILESAGYEVMAAVDGLDALNKLKTRNFDAIVSDVQMPNLDGLGLTAKIRQQKEYAELPIILVTSLASDEDKRQGAEAGANAYITKGTFDQRVLLDTLRRLI